ncbi:MAG TPA: enoyl-CoA hydratase-related protein [Kineosporiaceae bacterium]|nr:enoyl-CoA hydratase-related protein [Kineosporiaceae bacterium]
MSATPPDDATHRVSAARNGRLLTITLDRPNANNAMDDVAGRALAACAREATGPDVGAVLLRASGRNFSVGGDLRSFAQGADGLDGMPERVRTTVEAAHEAILALADLDIPVVSALQGWVAGIGISLGCCADVVIAGESTQFRSAYTGIGFTPDGGLTWLLPRLVGPARAADFVLSNRALTATEALAWGLVTRVVPDSDLDWTAEELAQSLADGPAHAQAKALRLLRRERREDLVRALTAEAESVIAQSASSEGREGVAAFFAKRPPNFHSSVAADF